MQASLYQIVNHQEVLSLKSVKIIVTGIVQGVGFRWAVAKRADHLGLTGLIQNQPDGSVYIELEGDETVLTPFVNWVENGPTPFAHVKHRQLIEQPLQHYATFQIY